MILLPFTTTVLEDGPLMTTNAFYSQPWTQVRPKNIAFHLIFDILLRTLTWIPRDHTRGLRRAYPVLAKKLAFSESSEAQGRDSPVILTLLPSTESPRVFHTNMNSDSPEYLKWHQHELHGSSRENNLLSSITESAEVTTLKKARSSSTYRAAPIWVLD